MEKDIPCEWKSKESWSSNTHIRWTSLVSTDWYKRQGKTVYNNLGINPRRRHNNVNIYAPNTGGLQCLKQMLTATTVKTEVPACSSRSWPLLWEVGGACQGLGSLSLTWPWGQSITRLHTHTDGEPTTSHMRTNPPYDSWGSSWPCLWEAPWCRHGTRVSGSNFPSISATTVKPWPSYFSLSLSFLICRLSRNRNCCGRSSQPKHFHPHPPPHMAHSKARQDGGYPVALLPATLNPQHTTASFFILTATQLRPREALGLAASHTAGDVGWSQDRPQTGQQFLREAANSFSAEIGGTSRTELYVQSREH